MHATTSGAMRTFRTLILTVLIALGAAAPAHAALRVTVRQGDNLAAIGERHGVSAQAIASANAIRNPAVITVGASLWIPSSGSSAVVSSMSRPAGSSGGLHTVAPGESLGAIAARYGTSASALARANGIADADHVVAGTRLRVSGIGAAATTTVTSSRWTSSGSSSGGVHTVAPGESLGSIAARYGTSVAALAAVNGIRNANVIVAGTRLRVATAGSSTATTSSSSSTPSTSGTHTVAAGESLGAIAARYGMSVSALARANGIADPNTVIAGTRLRVTGGAAAASSTSPPSGPLTPVTAATAGWGAHPGSAEVRDVIDAAAARHGVDPALVRAIAWQESGYWQGARSSTGAIGVMQLMPGTATWVGQALLGRTIDPTDVRDNVDAGTAYLAYLQRNAPSRDIAIAGYYQGLGSVTSRGLYDDTKAYVSSVNGHYGRR